MPSFRQGDVVRVPFPYTDRNTRQHRPALVVSSGGIESTHGLLWVAMITSAENRGWSGDVAVQDLKRAKLPVASIIRTAKLATIEAQDAEKLGTLKPANLAAVLTEIKSELGLSNHPPAEAKHLAKSLKEAASGAFVEVKKFHKK
ncbi:MAG: type II toxin-antitoxin system PemK/MazF family toxin [Parvibaculum sp.]|nr:type II toxin-antitoxin system PemK/MazF family toxin [Parvibaculum sp.]